MTDAILIVGSGVAGLHAAALCANAGARAIVVEKGPVAGGHLAAAMSDTQSIGDRAGNVSIPSISDLDEHDDISIMTLTELESISGRPGNFNVSLRQRARFVTDTCTRCNRCHTACPVVVPNEHDAGLTYRKAIYTPLGETLPPEFVIDISNCLNEPPNYLPCNRCAQVCDDDSIHFDMPLVEHHEMTVGAVIIASGFEIGHDPAMDGLGYGVHADVVTSAELQRLMETPGPTGGFATKPSNEAYPQSVLFVLDDPTEFGLYIVASQAHQLLDQGVDKVDVLLLAQAPTDAGDSISGLSADTGVNVHWGGMFRVNPDSKESVDVAYEDFKTRRHVAQTCDLVVICADPKPPAGMADLAARIEIELSADGYVATALTNPATSRDGVYVAGCAGGPKDIPHTIVEATLAANAALADLNPRLLNPDYSPADTDEQQGIDVDAGLRQRLERMLFALIDSP